MRGTLAQLTFFADFCRPESMLATLQVMRDEYGSVGSYVVDQCGLSTDEVDQLRKNMTAKLD